MPMALADRFTAIVFFALGFALLAGGWTMDRLEIRQIHPASIPGLVPMILGVLLMLCAVLLFRSSFAEGRISAQKIFSGGSWTRLGLTMLTCTGYALILVGWLSYFWATAIFTCAFTLIFSFPATGDRRAKATSVVGSMALAAAVAFGSAFLFQEMFLVRLP